MFLGVLIKELQLLRRDPRVIVRLIVLPVAFIVLFGKVLNGAPHPARGKPIAVWHDAAAAHATAVTAALEASGMFAITAEPSADAVRAAVASETFDVGLVLGADFDPVGGHPGELVIDLGGPSTATGPLEGSLNAIVTRAVEGTGPPPRVLVPTTPPGIKPTLDGMSSFQISVPGNAVLFGFFIALTCALSFAEERRTGTGRRLLAAPVARWNLLFAKLLPFIALGCVQVGLLFALGAFAFGMRIGGSLIALGLLTLGVSSCAASLGLLLAAVSTTEKQISSLGSVVVIIMGLLGGCMLPRVLMPHAMQQLGLFVPHGWALDGYYELLVREGASIADVAPQIAAVWGFAILFAVVGMRRFKLDPA